MTSVDADLLARWVAFANELVDKHGFDPRDVADASLAAAANVNVLTYGEVRTACQLISVGSFMCREINHKNSATQH